jgi:hypothetical protein
VLFSVPERLVPEVPEPPSAAMAAVPTRRRVLAMAIVTAFMRLSLGFRPMSEVNPSPWKPFRRAGDRAPMVRDARQGLRKILISLVISLLPTVASRGA